MHVIKKDEGLDDYGVSVTEGQAVVICQYYEHRGIKKSSYILRNKGLAFVLSFLVHASKFSLVQLRHNKKGGYIVYKIQDGDITWIKAIVDAYRKWVDSIEDQNSNEEE